ncbi:hypothetical protein [Actinopolymorpha alba]|nr:hypothetical protein [Actinopolymorpha alba]
MADASIFRTEYLWDGKLPEFDIKEQKQTPPTGPAWQPEPPGTLGPK